MNICHEHEHCSCSWWTACEHEEHFQVLNMPHVLVFHWHLIENQSLQQFEVIYNMSNSLKICYILRHSAFSLSILGFRLFVDFFGSTCSLKCSNFDHHDIQHVEILCNYLVNLWMSNLMKSYARKLILIKSNWKRRRIESVGNSSTSAILLWTAQFCCILTKGRQKRQQEKHDQHPCINQC